MKKLTAALSILIILLMPMMASDMWNSRIITINSGTAVRVVANSVKANSIVVQMLHGGTGLGYVLAADPQTTCAYNGAGTSQIAELGPASSTAPGQAVTIPSNGSATTQQGGQDLQYICIDGSHTGDTVLVSWNVR